MANQRENQPGPGQQGQQGQQGQKQGQFDQNPGQKQHNQNPTQNPGQNPGQKPSQNPSQNPSQGGQGRQGGMGQGQEGGLGKRDEAFDRPQNPAAGEAGSGRRLEDEDRDDRGAGRSGGVK